MPNLLVIEDHMKMVEMIQKYLETINEGFCEDNTFCFSSSPTLKLDSLTSFKDIDKTSSRVTLEGRKDEVFSAIFQFLNDHSEENVLILIDVLLNSQNISAPSVERYWADNEYSCEIYAELLRIKNGKKIEGYDRINPEKMFHIIYSRSDASIGVVAPVLSELSRRQSDEDRKYFPEECARFENISWCWNGYERTNADLSISEEQNGGSVPLRLPREYEKFVKELI